MNYVRSHFLFSTIPKKKKFLNDRWPQFSILNQNFGIIWVIMKLQNFLLGKKKGLLTFCLFLKNGGFKHVHKFFNTPPRKKHTFLPFPPLEPMWTFMTTSTNKIWQKWHYLTFKPRGKKKTNMKIVPVFPGTLTFKPWAARV